MRREGKWLCHRIVSTTRDSIRFVISYCSNVIFVVIVRLPHTVIEITFSPIPFLAFRFPHFRSERTEIE